MTKILIDEAVVWGALKDLEVAQSVIGEWGSYASAYFQEKHGLADDIEALTISITALRQALADAALDKLADNAREFGLTYDASVAQIDTSPERVEKEAGNKHIAAPAQPLTTPQGWKLVPMEPTVEMLAAMAGSKALDDEGEFQPLCDLIDFSGENKTRTVIKAAYCAALAATPPAPAQPYCYTYTENGEEFFAPPTAYVPENAIPLYTTPPAPAQQELCGHEACDCRSYCKKHPPQPPAQLLTDEQIRKWWASENGLEDCRMSNLEDFRRVVRAIEAKLKEKNT